MKKMLMAACAVMVLVSCGKEEIPTIEQELGQKSLLARVFTGQRCIAYQGTCHDDVVVNGNDQKVVDDVFDVIKKGNKSKIKTAFSQNQRVLGQYLTLQDISDVIGGTLDATATDGDSKGSIHYMVLSASGQSTNWKSVYPFLD